MTPIRALLVTDLVDSTQLAAALGEVRLAEVSAAHDRLARERWWGDRRTRGREGGSEG